MFPESGKPRMFEEDLLTNESEARDFINKYGVVTLFPVKDKSFPSLYKAAKGSRDEKIRDSWIWADNLAFKKHIHYGKLVRKQVTLVSLEMFPYFYRLGREEALSETAQSIVIFLKERGKASTTELRENLNFGGKDKKNEFLKAIDELQMTFTIAIVGREKPPRLTHIYDIMERWMPRNLLEKANRIGKDAAKTRIIAKMLDNAIISRAADAKKFFSLRLVT